MTDKPEILFARLDIKEVLEKVEAKNAAEAAKEAKEAGIDIEPKEEISYDDFMKMQFQVGEIISCEEVKKSKKTALLPGKNRQPGTSDRIRHQSPLKTGRYGRQKSNGAGKLKTGKTGRRYVRRHDPLCGR